MLRGESIAKNHIHFPNTDACVSANGWDGLIHIHSCIYLKSRLLIWSHDFPSQMSGNICKDMSDWKQWCNWKNRMIHQRRNVDLQCGSSWKPQNAWFVFYFAALIKVNSIYTNVPCAFLFPVIMYDARKAIISRISRSSPLVLEEVSMSQTQKSALNKDLNKKIFSLICVYFNFFQGILGETSDLCTYRTQTLHDHQSEKTRFKMGVPSQNLLNTQRYKPWSVVPHVERSAQFEGTAFPTICMWFPHLD